MKNHTKIYLDFFDYGTEDFIPSEISGKRAVDINHIDAKGMGGNPTRSKDTIENLMALTRREHDILGDRVDLKDELRKIHLKFMEDQIPLIWYDKDHFLFEIL